MEGAGQPASFHLFKPVFLNAPNLDWCSYQPCAGGNHEGRRAGAVP
jgi:hypothetical protein